MTEEGDPAIRILESTDDAIHRFFDLHKKDGLKFEGPDGRVQQIPIHEAFDDVHAEDGETQIVITPPNVFIVSEDADERHRDTGIFDVSVFIEVNSHVEHTTKIEHGRRFGVVAAMLWRSDFVSGINALNPKVPEYTAKQWTRLKIARSIEEDIMTHRIEGMMMCFPSDI